MNWKPIGPTVIVKKTDPDNDTTMSGIVLVGVDANDKTLEAEVVAVGTRRVGHIAKDLDVSVGDVVMYNKQYGTDISSRDFSTSDDFMLLHEDDIIAIVG